VRSNLVISSVLILGYYSAGKTSVTGLISSTVLILPRLVFWIKCACVIVMRCGRAL
jgi:hypothetical protein